jgi:hypothetical protein
VGANFDNESNMFIEYVRRCGIIFAWTIGGLKLYLILTNMIKLRR